jgi:hypothetical protein
MLDRHPSDGWPVLARRALAGSAEKEFRALVKGRSRRALAAIEAALGEEARKTIEKTFKVKAKLEAHEILAVMDAAKDRQEWPLFKHEIEPEPERQYIALRIVAARGEGDEWGVCLDRLSGGDWDHLRVDRHVFGSAVTSSVTGAPAKIPDVNILGLAANGGPAVGSSIRGPAGMLVLEKSDVKALDLRPGKGTEPGGGGDQLVLVRAYLAKYPGTIFPPVEDALEALALPSAPRMLIAMESFAHAGASSDAPSKSKTYKSLAKALVACDEKAFEPGKSNTDWRRHVVK